MSKTKKVMAGISSTIIMLGLVGCASDYESQEIPPAPDDPSCSDWEWDMDDGVWECEEGTSSHYGHSYYRGRYYDSKSSLYKSKDYIDYKNSASFAGISDGSVKKSSGFGSGIKSFGG